MEKMEKRVNGKEKEKPLILVTNDDGVFAKGFISLVEVAKEFGRVMAIAPSTGQSGMSHAITVKYPIRVELIENQKHLTIFSCSGTPVDSVKLAMNQLMPVKPDLIISGINHGSNSAASVIYSGTMAAAIEGCLNQVPSIGFSLLDFSSNANFSGAQIYARHIIQMVLKNGIPSNTCLNVNVPAIDVKKIKGIKICRQNKGYWQEEFEKRRDPQNKEYYWLTGVYKNAEPEALDTDEWALRNHYVSMVPVHVDLTAYNALEELNKWDFNVFQGESQL